MNADELKRRDAVLKYLAGKRYFSVYTALSEEWEFKYFLPFEAEMLEEQKQSGFQAIDSIRPENTG